MSSSPTITAASAKSVLRRTRRSSLRDLGPYLKNHSKMLCLVAVVSLGATCLALMQPFAVQTLVNSVTAGAFDPSYVWVLIVITLGSTLFNAVQFFFLQRVAEGVVLDVRRSLVVSLFGLSIREFDRRRTGDLVARISSDTTLIRGVITSGIFEIVSSVLMFLAAAVLMSLLDPVLFLITVVAVAIGAGSVVLIGSKVRRRTKLLQDQVGVLSAEVERAITGIRMIKASVAEKRELQSLDEEAVGAYRAGVAVAKLQTLVQPVMTVCIQGSFILVLAVGGIRVAEGSMQLGDLIAFILYLFLLVAPVGTSMSAIVQVHSGLAALDRVREIRGLSAEDADETSISAATEWDPSRSIRFENVTFHYDEDEAASVAPFTDMRFTESDGKSYSASAKERSFATPTLDRVSFEIPAKRRTAIVGPSGAGKSTILSLIERFYEPDSGSIYVGDTELREISRSKLRGRIALVDQDSLFLSGTLAENLRVSSPRSSDGDIHQALEAVGLEDIALRSSDGIHVNLGEAGVRLSGGQRQRLAWARALLANRDVLLLDEPTSAVDARSEERLQSILGSMGGKKTVVAIAHRLATIEDFDQILVMDSGRIIGTGTHEELLRNNHLYRSMAQKQGLDMTTNDLLRADGDPIGSHAGESG